MKKLAIIGASELGCLIAHHAITDNQYDVFGFYDDYATESKYFSNLPVVGTLKQVSIDYKAGKFDCLMVGIGYHRMDIRKKIFEMFKGVIPFGNLFHSTSYIDKTCIVGEGVFVLPGCHVDFMAELGDNVTIQVGCVIAHHTKLNEHTFLGPGVKMAGLINVEECCFLGVGSVIKDSLNIGNNSIIGAGAVVVKDVPEKTVSVGSPAKVIKSIS